MQSDSVMPPREDGSRPGGMTWSSVLVLLLIVLSGIVGAYFETSSSIVSIWLRSDTFAHGFLIAPISIWLVWDKRAILRQMRPQPAFVPLLLMLPVGFVWLLGYLVDVLVVQQFAFVGVLVLAIWSVLGTPVARVLAFPMGFLFLGVPVGEGLIYPMMNFTADFTVAMLRLTGMPVYRDGTFFSIPSGDWSVVEACSGVRYLIASVTLGVLYAYLTYTRLWKRLVFVAVSIAVPILANGMRAYLIVMIAHTSDMKLAVGVDHLIYGWVFFGIVVTILFFVGAFWRDPPPEEPEGIKNIPARGTNTSVAATGLAAVAVAGLWPALAWTLAPAEGGVREVRLESPAAVGGWHLVPDALWDWRPNVVGPDGERYDFYVDDQGKTVGVYLGVFRTQRQGAELLSSQNQMVVQKHPMWRDKEQTARQIQLRVEDTQINQSRLGSRRDERLLVWNWYRIGDRYTANPYLGKMLEAMARLFGQRQDATLIVVAAPYEEKERQAALVMQAFIDRMLPSIEQELDRALQQLP